MKYILNSREMKQCDENTMRRRGMLSAVLMERAALATMQEIVNRYPNPATKVLVVCGSGNNGGALSEGIQCDNLFCRKPGKSDGGNKTADVYCRTVWSGNF